MTWTERSKQIFEQEIAEFQKVANSIGDEFNQAIEMIYACKGKVVIMGIGKTGIVGHKIAASLASTGTPAIFVNAAEAMHGDLGMVAKNDIALLISHSGTSSEIVNICTPLKNIGAQIIAITGNPHSPLAQEAKITINVPIEREVCPLNLAPTTSTTATMLLGDALMVCLMERRQFKAENFALYHPGGALGRQLLSRVKHRMSTSIPRVIINTTFNDIIYTVSDGRKGMTLVYDHENKCVGIITDGDIRRAIQHHENIKSLTAADIMTHSFKHIHQEAMITQALEIMDANNITSLAVTDIPNSNNVIGILHIHDIIDFR
ncbi:MAG: KpsF/GutQ family sugar-phosphate isomerase [Paludibacteraceae bacterium]|nr:KpsF/GutQ family sugar-phosphate isomerase [Paludibacteraceae bacterium]